ncbi:uncharacterized protein EV154DRAFT_525036 [Mucor mucedo]|uniref:uncharacterized protein n=1 Tax=Mucor mucedo TaxID=29922 RepID=UPI00221F6192|nr:uncharacterized protein EV154DRAFT_525036 [Mucor mucedo]KAI7878371.1 hypothetical protein EV154DRAFT_525036 [Mucor mucedo]
MPKSVKKPSLIGVDPQLEITLNECKSRKINPILHGLKLKYWTHYGKLANCALKNCKKQDADSIIRAILAFFTNIKTSFAANMAVSKYGEACKNYFSDLENKTNLQEVIRIKLDLKDLEELDKETLHITHSLRSKTKSQKALANAAKDYQAAKFEADALLKALDVEIISSSSDDDTPELQAPLTQSSISETDNVFTVQNQTESVGKRIKQEALNIHNEYVKGVNIGSEAKLVMDLGLSSILDLTHEKDAYQKYIFSDQEWKQLEDYFNKKYKFKITASIPKNLTDTWSTVAQLAIHKGTFTALKYISKFQSLESTSEVNFIYFEIFRHVVLTLHEDASLINSIIENNGSISEQDVYTLWFPIIKRIVSIKKIIRMKQGETINLYTTKRKQAQYSDHEKVKGFKIDVRLLLDYSQNEIDLCAGEVAINTFDTDKLIHDRSKCIRESKDICDHHIEAGLGRDSVGWGIQISGLEARLMSIHLFREGLFVAVCQDTFLFPQNIEELPDFMHTLKGLEYLIERNQVEANKLIGIYDKINRSYNPSLNSEYSTSTSTRTSQSSYNSTMTTSPTYYTPPSGQRNKSVIPNQLFYKEKRRLFHERVVIGEDNPEVVTLETKGDEDMFGWVEMVDDTWYNSVTGEKSDVSPYQ